MNLIFHRDVSFWFCFANFWRIKRVEQDELNLFLIISLLALQLHVLHRSRLFWELLGACFPWICDYGRGWLSISWDLQDGFSLFVCTGHGQREKVKLWFYVWSFCQEFAFFIRSVFQGPSYLHIVVICFYFWVSLIEKLMFF